MNHYLIHFSPLSLTILRIARFDQIAKRSANNAFHCVAVRDVDPITARCQRSFVTSIVCETQHVAVNAHCGLWFDVCRRTDERISEWCNDVELLLRWMYCVTGSSVKIYPQWAREVSFMLLEMYVRRAFGCVDMTVPVFVSALRGSEKCRRAKKHTVAAHECILKWRFANLLLIRLTIKFNSILQKCNYMRRITIIHFN